MTAFTLAGVEDVAGEQTSDSVEWLRAEGIDLEVMQAVIGSAERNFNRFIARDNDVFGAVADVVGQAFRLGWESHKRATS